jgi:hypothetical protein
MPQRSNSPYCLQILAAGKWFSRKAEPADTPQFAAEYVKYFTPQIGYKLSAGRE